MARSVRLDPRLLSACYTLAAVRLLLFIAAWPAFHNADEQQHVDMILKAARGRVPAGLERYDPESARLIARAETWEILGTPGPGRPPPAWRTADGGRHEASRRVLWAAAKNHESTAPPVPYLLGGAWHRAGALLGLDGPAALYWLRLLNVPVYLAAMAGAVRLAVLSYPGDPVLPAALAVLLAVLPQDLYYGVSADVPSVLFGTLALLGLWRIGLRGFRSAGDGARTGLLVALTLLTKYSNVAILVPLAVVVFRRLRASGRREAGRVALLTGAAMLPVAAWLLRNAVVLGDATGVTAKVQALRWTPRPLDAVFQHPLFSARGMLEFARGLAETAWRGELFWHGARLAWPALDAWFALSTGACLLAIRFVRRPSSPADRRADGICLAMVGASAVFLAAVSLAFDFGTCRYPSRDKPFLVSARLVSAALVPFLILYVRGLGRIVGGGPRRRFGVVLLLAGVLLGTELWMSREVFASPFNWFHGPWRR